MVTFCIIEDLKEKGTMYEVDRYKGNTLWIADDTTLIADSVQNMERNIEVIRNSAREYGLVISKKKAK